MGELERIIDAVEKRLGERMFNIEKNLRKTAIINWVTVFALGAFVFFFILFFISYKYL